MKEFDENIEYDGNIPEGFRAVQQTLDGFVKVNYETAQGIVIRMKLTQEDLSHNRGKILDIIRSNPPLASIPRYFHDGREDYLWYSEFYDNISKELYHQYRTFLNPVNEITTSNYTEELTKINLPYFKELVNLISLERLCIKYEKYFLTPKDNIVQEKLPTKKNIKAKEAKSKLTKRSYQPKLSKEQYALLTDCIEAIKLFRQKVKISELRKLLSGKLTEPLQVTNQKLLVYLLDQLSEHKFIKEKWMAVADGNKNFISFQTEGNKERYGDNTHYINMQQLLNCRNRNKKELIYGLENIDNLIEQIQENLAE